MDNKDPHKHWTEDARCYQVDEQKNFLVDVNIFFPPRDKTKYKKIAAEAKNYCFGENRKNPCPIRTQCLWYAIEEDIDHGIWGGMSHRERNALVRKWNKKFKDQYTLEEYVKQLDKPRA
jgi:hypothetical protein